MPTVIEGLVRKTKKQQKRKNSAETKLESIGVYTHSLNMDMNVNKVLAVSHGGSWWSD